MATEEMDMGSREVKFKGVFVLNELLLLLYRWFSSKQFVKSEEQFGEKYLIQEELSNGARNVSMEWEFVNNSGMIRKTINLTLRGIALTKGKVNRNGVNIDVDNGEITLSIKAKMEVDPDEEFQKGFIRKQFYKYIWKPLNGKFIKMNKDDFGGDFDKLYEALLNFFEIKQDKPDTWVRNRGMNI